MIIGWLRLRLLLLLLLLLFILFFTNFLIGSQVYFLVLDKYVFYLSIEASRSHSVGLLWKNDQLDAETST